MITFNLYCIELFCISVSSSLKQNKSFKSDSPSSTKQTEEKTVVNKVNTSKSTGPTSFLDNSSRVTGVQDVLTRMRNADLGKYINYLKY